MGRAASYDSGPANDPVAETATGSFDEPLTHAPISINPLQFQKQLRVQKTRRLLLSESLDANRVAYQLGYHDGRTSAVNIECVWYPTHSRYSTAAGNWGVGRYVGVTMRIGNEATILNQV